ncbi:tetratricopeptide repeat protein [Hymenobacter sp. BT523]|uniref:tetratricopeptide repeat protein n=1 Tax=Hymenobacter sp. BT523 TaxID=2795725 RepID=UPI0018ECB611|nr:tetratricopeptide repeat protein [Hymenobacter sp. BT523]MBJ6110391.1 tetratricopeptide repeat protein [Hymenobacter sp. BT523]
MTKYLLRWCLLLASLASCTGRPEEAKLIFQQGNERLARADYAGAIRCYRQLERQGVRRPELYCNLGTACYKTGQLGWAVYCYEQGLQLAPADTQLAANQRMAWRKACLPAVPRSAFAPGSPALLLATDAGAKAAVGGLLLGAALVVLAGWGRRGVRAAALLRAGRYVLLAAGGLLGLATGAGISYTRHGIVVGAAVAGRSGPSPAARKAFDLQSGEQVVIENRYQGWLKIKRASGEAGWAPAPAVAVLQPR